MVTLKITNCYKMRDKYHLIYHKKEILMERATVLLILIGIDFFSVKAAL